MIAEADLAHALEALHLPRAEEVERKLLDFLELLRKWNRVYNLTAVRETDRMLTHHVIDSLAVAPHLPGTSLLDVGSGAGLPGLPLAIVKPELRVTLLDSSQKKTAFLKQARIELGLESVDVVTARVEAWSSPRTYDVVISRAFSELADFAALAVRHCAPDGVLVAMKGVYPEDELARLPAGIHVSEVIPLRVPGLAAQRHMVVMRAS